MPLFGRLEFLFLRNARERRLEHHPEGKEIVLRGPPAEGEDRLIHQRGGIEDAVYRLYLFLPFLVRKSRGKGGGGIYNIAGNLLPAKGNDHPLPHTDLAFQFRRALIDEGIFSRA